jgi:hypothetical protein
MPWHNKRNPKVTDNEEYATHFLKSIGLKQNTPHEHDENRSTSPEYSPTSPKARADGNRSTSPEYSPTSPQAHADGNRRPTSYDNDSSDSEAYLANSMHQLHLRHNKPGHQSTNQSISNAHSDKYCIIHIFQNLKCHQYKVMHIKQRQLNSSADEDAGIKQIYSDIFSICPDLHDYKRCVPEMVSIYKWFQDKNPKEKDPPIFEYEGSKLCIKGFKQADTKKIEFFYNHIKEYRLYSIKVKNKWWCEQSDGSCTLYIRDIESDSGSSWTPYEKSQPASNTIPITDNAEFVHIHFNPT